MSVDPTQQQKTSPTQAFLRVDMPGWILPQIFGIVFQLLPPFDYSPPYLENLLYPYLFLFFFISIHTFFPDCVWIDIFVDQSYMLYYGFFPLFYDAQLEM